MRQLKRWIFLFLGFACYGLAIAMMVRADLGLGPWDAFHQGVAIQTGLKIGTAAMIVGAVVMLFWLPLRQKPGIGTVLNVLCIGPMTNVALDLIPTAHDVVMQWALMLGGVVVISIGSALYLPTKLGAGPRDGLMLGLHQKFGLSIRVARTIVEVCVLGIGWWLGGTVGLGTIAFACLIGPLVHWMLDLEKKLGLVG
ncbi:YitT family protein [Dongia sp.]|uniref:membrane protein YczE n=1 Tax=Dongia sp. TaxID=1977262 RepID=UPI003753BE72